LGEGGQGSQNKKDKLRHALCPMRFARSRIPMNGVVFEIDSIVIFSQKIHAE